MEQVTSRLAHPLKKLLQTLPGWCLFHPSPPSSKQTRKPGVKDQGLQVRSLNISFYMMLRSESVAEWLSVFDLKWRVKQCAWRSYKSLKILKKTNLGMCDWFSQKKTDFRLKKQGFTQPCSSINFFWHIIGGLSSANTVFLQSCLVMISLRRNFYFNCHSGYAISSQLNDLIPSKNPSKKLSFYGHLHISYLMLKNSPDHIDPLIFLGCIYQL